ncbi:MAG: hypothetical protein F6J93_40305 [Oscillatoria sp. SIO1A7]|nr:hypothetical protein [Oscillatoria sp. SIO1A7]
MGHWAPTPRRAGYAYDRLRIKLGIGTGRHGTCLPYFEGPQFPIPHAPCPMPHAQFPTHKLTDLPTWLSCLGGAIALLLKGYRHD